MKKYISALIFTFVFSNFLFAQDIPKTYLVFNTSISTGSVSSLSFGMKGGAAQKGQLGLLAGIGFVRNINEKFDIGLGLDISGNAYETSYIDDGRRIIEEDLKHIKLLSIPLNFRFKMKRNFFISAGIQYDHEIDISVDNQLDDQTGIGINVKFGKDFRLGDKTILSLSPEIIIHSIIPSHSTPFHDNMQEIGLRIRYKIGI